MSDVLVDSSFLYALDNPKDRFHVMALAFSASSKDTRLIPDVVLPEVTFLLSRSPGQPAVLRFLDSLVATQPQLTPLTLPDIQRARAIMATYADADFDFVDCCLMALAERLDIKQVCTFDRRDFAIFRPNHCDYLDLLP